MYVQPFSGSGRKIRWSTDGGLSPVWSRDGHELFYRQGQGLISVRVAPSAADLSPARPELLFQTKAFNNYDIAADGRFLVIVDTTVASRPTVFSRR